MKRRKLILILIIMTLSVLTINTYAEELINELTNETKNGLVVEKGKTYYYVDGELQVGFQETEKGIMFFSRDKKQYGVMRTGKLQVENDFYILNPSLQTGLFEFEGQMYYANEEGVLQGGFQETEKGIMFFSRDLTKYGMRKTGKLQVGNDFYILNPNLKIGKIIYAGSTYYANEDGILQGGFLELEDEKTYFFSRDLTKYGMMKTGRIQIGDEYYFFNPYLQTGAFEYNGENYYANEEGLLEGGFQETEEGILFFSRDPQKYGVRRTGKFQIGNDYYVFNPYMQTGTFKYEGDTYYANDDGILQGGFQKTEEGTIFFSRDPQKYGVMRTGKFQVGNDYYVFNPILQTGDFTYNGNKYHANENGVLQGGFQETEEGTIFFSRDPNNYGVMRTGKFQIGNDYYVFNPTLQKGSFEYQGGKYYANNNGVLQVGFVKINGNTYFYSRDITQYGKMKTGTFRVGYNDYTFNSEGVLVKVQYIPVYYNQKDSRWSSIWYGPRQFGPTGCAPTAMASAFQVILDRVILPNEIGDFLYYQTDEYNKKAIGSSGLAIKYASEKYGIKINPIYSKEQMREYLERGLIVFAVMGDGKFATKTYNHAILLYQYNNGKTLAMDPLLTSNNGWVSLDLIFNEQSKDPDDSTAGSNFYALEKR